MAQPSINLLAVLVAAVVHIVLGFLWYGPVFGKTWMGLMGLNQKDLEKKKKDAHMGKSYAIMIIGTLVMSYVLAHFVDYTDATTFLLGMQAGFWIWLGFVAPVTLSSVLWEGKSWKLYLLNNAYNLLGLVIAGGILAAWA